MTMTTELDRLHRLQAIRLEWEIADRTPGQRVRCYCAASLDGGCWGPFTARTVAVSQLDASGATALRCPYCYGPMLTEAQRIERRIARWKRDNYPSLGPWEIGGDEGRYPAHCERCGGRAARPLTVTRRCMRHDLGPVREWAEGWSDDQPSARDVLCCGAIAVDPRWSR